MNASPLSRDLAQAFSRPFRSGGKHMLLSLLFLLLPVTSFISRGAAYGFAAGRRDGPGGWAKLGLKILAAQLLLAAPAIFFYAVYKTFDALYEAMPLWFHLLMTAALLYTGVRTAVLSPVSACCLALGAPLRTAVNGKELKSIVGLGVARYLLAAVISLLMLFVVGAVGRGLHLIPAYLAGAVLMTLWNFFSAGLFMGACRFALGIAPPRDSGGYPPPRSVRAVAGVLALALLLFAAPTPAFAAPPRDQPIPVNPAEGAAGNGEAGTTMESYADAYRYFSERGAIRPGEDIGYDRSSKTYYVIPAETASEMRAPGEAIIHTADVVSDFIPVLGNIKSGLQANYYYHQALKTDDPELKKQYSAVAGYKAAGLLLGGIGKGLKAGSAGAKALGYVDKGSKYYDGVANFLTYIDIFRNTDLSSKIGPHRIAEFVDDFEDVLFKPRMEPKNILIDFDPSGMPADYTVPVHDGTAQLAPGYDLPPLAPIPALPDADPAGASPQPGAAPTSTPAPTPKPTAAPTPRPTAAPTPKPTEAPLPVSAFMGTWIDAEGGRMILMASGDNVIEKEPDLAWYGGDVLCTEYRVKYDESARTLYLSGLTSWVVGPELLDAAAYEKRPLEIDASSASMELEAAEVRDGVITKLYMNSELYTRP